jgi:hypothetical protein
VTGSRDQRPTKEQTMNCRRLLVAGLLLAPCAVIDAPMAAAADPGAMSGTMIGMSGMSGTVHPAGNVELFLSLRGQTSSKDVGPPDLDERSWGVGDLVFSGERGRLRLMGEYNLSTAEHDFERLQVGIEPVPDTLVWLGRFHQPGSAWNNEFHHGPYLQTAISRPSIELWEDEHGFLPQHLMGALAESRWPIAGGHGLQAALGLGYGSVLVQDGSKAAFDPIGVLESSGGGHHVSTTAQFAFQPDYLGQSSAGFLFAHHLSGIGSPAVRASLLADEVAQESLGAYIHYVGDRSHWLAVVYRVAARYDARGSQPVRERFSAGYLQVEVPLPHRLTLYARHETAPGAADARLPRLASADLVLHGNFAGLRLDLPYQQALTLEASRATLMSGALNRLRLQWSAAFP